MTQTEYLTVRLPQRIVERVDEAVKNNNDRYRSRAGFVKAAIHLRLAELMRHHKRPKK